MVLFTAERRPVPVMDLRTGVSVLVIVSWLLGYVSGDVIVTIEPETPKIGEDVYITCKYVNDDQTTTETHAIWWSRIHTFENGTKRYCPLRTDNGATEYDIVTMMSKANAPMKSILKFTSVTNKTSDWYACSVWTSEGSESANFYLPVEESSSTVLSTLVMVVVAAAGILLFGFLIFSMDENKFWNATRSLFQSSRELESESSVEDVNYDTDVEDTPPRYSTVINDPVTFRPTNIFSIANTMLGRESRVISCALPSYDEALLDLIVEVEPKVKVEAEAEPPPSYEDLMRDAVGIHAPRLCDPV